MIPVISILHRRFIISVLTLGSVIAASTLARAEDAILQGIQITEKETTIDLQVDFSAPLQYMRHFPPNSGEILQIQLQVSEAERRKQEKAAEAAAGGAAPATAKRETMLPPSTESAPLINVTYEGEVPGGPFLTLRFKFPVDYVVAEGAGSKSIIVSLKKETGGLTVRAKAEGEDAMLNEEKMDELMEDVRQSLAREDYGRAIQLLTRMLQMPVHKHTQESKELLGVAREKKGQIARAKLEYQEYLRLYPEGEGAERVKQRLAAVELAQVAPREKLKEIKPQTSAQVDTFGRVSQRFYQDTTALAATGSSADTTTTRSTLTSFLNVSSRYRDEQYDMRGFFNAHDVRTMQGSGRDESEINSAYVDIKNRSKKYSALIGRQSSNKGGVFGRFDGLWASYEYKPKYEVSATVGQPVTFSSGDIGADRLFYGASISIAAPKDSWGANGYYIEQKIDSLVDRRAVGGDVRYADKVYSLFASVDYDLFYNVLNLVFVRGGWKANDQTRIDVNYNVRQSPLVLTTNAMQQDTSTTVTKFKDLYTYPGVTTRDIYDKVPKVSSLSHMLTIGAVYDLDQNNQINADVTVSTIDARDEFELLKCLHVTDPACAYPANVAAKSEKYGPEYSYSAQLISSNYFVERDIHIAGGRYSNGEGRSSTSIFLRSRFPYGEQWYIGPRVQLDRSRTESTTGTTTLMHPSASVKIDYRWKKQVSLEAELGYEINDFSGPSSTDYTRTTLFLGYNYDF